MTRRHCLGGGSWAPITKLVAAIQYLLIWPPKPADFIGNLTSGIIENSAKRHSAKQKTTKMRATLLDLFKLIRQHIWEIREALPSDIYRTPCRIRIWKDILTSSVQRLLVRRFWGEGQKSVWILGGLGIVAFALFGRGIRSCESFSCDNWYQRYYEFKFVFIMIFAPLTWSSDRTWVSYSHLCFSDD